MLEISRFHWTAFMELGRDRPLGMNGQGLIPLAAMREYCRDLEMTRGETEQFKRIICAVDNRRQVLIDKRRAKEAEKRAK